MVIDPRSVEVFYWVVQLGGFRRAAEKLGTTQPAVSARVAGLEAAVGAPLLERGRSASGDPAGGRARSVQLTAAGMLMISFAERQLALAGEMARAFGQIAEVVGTVRLGVAETLVHTWLPALLRQMHETYPRLEMDVVVDVSVHLRAGLLAGEFDVALLMGPVGAPGVQDLPICEHGLIWVARPDLELGAEPLGIEELVMFPVITYARQTTPYQQVREVLAGAGPGGRGGRIFANASLSSIVRMVRDGIGIGVVARAAVLAELESGVIRVVAVTPQLSPLRFTASWRDGPGGGLGATVARMAEAVAREWGDHEI